MRQGTLAAFVHGCINHRAQAVIRNDEAILVGVEPLVQRTVRGIARHQLLNLRQHGVERAEVDQSGRTPNSPSASSWKGISSPRSILQTHLCGIEKHRAQVGGPARVPACRAGVSIRTERGIERNDPRLQHGAASGSASCSAARVGEFLRPVIGIDVAGVFLAYRQLDGEVIARQHVKRGRLGCRVR